MPKHTGRPSILVVATAAVLVTTACGSTVQLAGRVPADGLGSAGVGSDSSLAGGGTLPTSPVGANGQTTGIAPVGGTGGNTSVPGAGSAPAGVSNTGMAGGIASRGPGWDAKNVYVGYTNLRDFSTAMNGLGISSLDPGDAAADVAAVIKYVNDHGGLFGRQMKGVEFNASTANAYGDPSTTSQAACTNFTQDHPVIAVLNFVPPYETDTFHACLAKRKVFEFVGANSPTTKAKLAKLAPFIAPLYNPASDRIAASLPGRLQARGYFQGWDTNNGAPSSTAPVRTGVVYADTPAGQQIRDLLTRALTSAGHAPATTIGVTSTSDFQGAVLKLRQAGVTHVFSYDIANFITAASGQNYYPRYAVTSEQLPVTLATSKQYQSSLRGSMGIGWIPTEDTNAEDTSRSAPGRARCLSIMRAGGQTFDANHRFAELIALDICDSVLLAAGAATAGQGLDSNALARGLAKIGPTFTPSLTFRSGISAVRQDEPAAAYDLVFAPSCTCYQYIGGLSAL